MKELELKLQELKEYEEKIFNDESITDKEYDTLYEIVQKKINTINNAIKILKGEN